jgi:hypothetical protein
MLPDSAGSSEVEVCIRAFFQKAIAFGVCFHQAVFDGVVHHFRVMPRAGFAEVVPPVCRGEGVEYR